MRGFREEGRWQRCGQQARRAGSWASLCAVPLCRCAEHTRPAPLTTCTQAQRRAATVATTAQAVGPGSNAAGKPPIPPAAVGATTSASTAPPPAPVGLDLVDIALRSKPGVPLVSAQPAAAATAGWNGTLPAAAAASLAFSSIADVLAAVQAAAEDEDVNAEEVRQQQAAGAGKVVAPHQAAQGAVVPHGHQHHPRLLRERSLMAALEPLAQGA